MTSTHSDILLLNIHSDSEYPDCLCYYFRRLFSLLSFLLFLYNGFAGFVGAIIRVAISAVVSLLLLFRLDTPVMAKGFGFLDFGKLLVNLSPPDRKAVGNNLSCYLPQFLTESIFSFKIQWYHTDAFGTWKSVLIREVSWIHRCLHWDKTKCPDFRVSTFRASTLLAKVCCNILTVFWLISLVNISHC